MFRTVPLSIIRSFSLYTQQWYMSHRFADSLRIGSGWNCGSVVILLARCQQTCVTYTIAVCTVKKTPDDGQRNCPKHVEFYSKNKFENLVHLVCFILRIIFSFKLFAGKLAGRDQLNCHCLNGRLYQNTLFISMWEVLVMVVIVRNGCGNETCD